jgi:hypothetical protein
MKRSWKAATLVVGLVLVTSEAVNAQIVTIANVNYTGANPPMQPNSTARPQGTYSVPVVDVNKQWRVRVDFVTISGGFVSD